MSFYRTCVWPAHFLSELSAFLHLCVSGWKSVFRGVGGETQFHTVLGPPKKFLCRLFLSSCQQQVVTHCVCVSACVTVGRAEGGEEGVEEEEPAPL